MRFHHSTRRRPNRLHGSTGPSGAGHAYLSNTSMSRKSQLGYCRESSIYFFRRMPVEPPGGVAGELQFGSACELITTNGAGSTTTATILSATTTNRSNKLQDKYTLQTNLNRLSIRETCDNQLDQSTPVQTQIETRIRTDTSTGSRGDSIPKDPQQSDGKIEPQLNDNLEIFREKLVAQVEKRPFWSSKAARRMQLTGLQERRIYMYELLSYCERRDLEWRFEPYRGGLVSSGYTMPYKAGQACRSSEAATPTGINNTSLCGRSFNSTCSSSGVGTGSPTRKNTPPPKGLRGDHGATPSSAGSSNLPSQQTFQQDSIPSSELVWSIEPTALTKPQPFTGYTHTSELPESSFVKRCHGCQGRGRLKCHSCHGVGYEVCIFCSGKGSIRSHVSAIGSSSGNSGGGRGADHDGAFSDSVSSSAFSANGTGSSWRRSEEPGGICNSSSGLNSSSSSPWTTESCHNCRGDGQKRCYGCAGRAYNNCHGCQGSGQLRCYLTLYITWINHKDEQILNNSDNIIPRERLRLSSGKIIVVEEAPRLEPLLMNWQTNQSQQNSGPNSNQSNQNPHQHHQHQQQHHNRNHHHHPHNDQSQAQTQLQTQLHPFSGNPSHLLEADIIYKASRRLLERHNHSYKNEVLIRQRHKVTQIECYVVSYEWKQRRGHFVIYGDEKKVYIAKYPFKSLCNIT